MSERTLTPDDDALDGWAPLGWSPADDGAASVPADDGILGSVLGDPLPGPFMYDASVLDAMPATRPAASGYGRVVDSAAGDGVPGQQAALDLASRLRAELDAQQRDMRSEVDRTLASASAPSSQPSATPRPAAGNGRPMTSRQAYRAAQSSGTGYGAAPGYGTTPGHGVPASSPAPTGNPYAYRPPSGPVPVPDRARPSRTGRSGRSGRGLGGAFWMLVWVVWIIWAVVHSVS